MFLITRAKDSKRRHALRQAIESLENRVLLSYTPDPTFAGDGVIDGAGGSSTAVQSDDKVLAADQDSNLHRYNVDGSPDMSFGGTGQIQTPFAIMDVLLSGSKILVAGMGGGSANSTFKVARYNLDGSPDLSFGGGDGIAQASVEDGALVSEAALAPGGKIVVAGQSWIEPDPNSGPTDPTSVMNVVRFNSDGTPDSSFAGNGTFEDVFVDSTGGGGGSVNDIAIQSDGKVILAGNTYEKADGTGETWIIRLNSDGTYDNTFHVQRFTNGPFESDVAITGGDKILVGGGDGVERYNADGTLDTSFHQWLDPRVSVEGLYALPDGRILVTGSGNGSPTSAGFVTRLLASGDPDPAFKSEAGNQYAFFEQEEYYSDGVEVLPDSHNRLVVGGEMQRTYDGPTDYWVARLADLPQHPKNGVPFSVGDTIQAEDFDTGGEQVAYHDSDAANRGGAYRPTESVDIEPTSDTGGGYDVGWTQPGEWMEYTINVPTTGAYDIQTRLANTDYASFMFQLDGADWEEIDAPHTGGFQKWTTLTWPFQTVQAGTHVLRVLVRESGQGDGSLNFNWFRIVPASQTGKGNGLLAIYNNNLDSTGDYVPLNDAFIDFNWGTGSPFRGIDPDTFAVDWTGAIEAPVTGRYTFYSTTDDGVRLTINGLRLIDHFTPQAATTWTGSIDLVAGQKYSFDMQYFDRYNGALARLEWSAPGIARQVVPTAYLYTNGEIPGDMTAPSAVPNFRVGSTRDTSVTLLWDAASDNVAVTGYELHMDDAPDIVLGPDVRTFTFNNLQPGTTHTFVIRAVDAQANHGPSSTVQIRTSGGTPATSGLKGEYFNNSDFTAPVLTRTDSSINFNWGTGSPAAGIDPDTFSVRWTGKISVPTTGRYTFYTTTDDGVRLWVNNQLLIDKLVPQAATEWSGSIDLVAGQQYDIRMDYFDRSGGAQAKLSWAGPGIAKSIVPPSAFGSSGDSQAPSAAPNFHSTFAGPDSIALSWDDATDNVGVAGYEMKVDNRTPVILDSNANTYVLDNLQPNTTYTFALTAFDAAGNRGPTSTISVTTAQATSTGNGLKGEYFNNIDFTSPAFTRTDANINFNWGTASPDPSRMSDPDTFSVRWTGFITVPTTGRYTFYTTTDDGARLTVNGIKVIDKLVAQAATEWSGSIDLVAGQKYAFNMEYFDRYGGAQARLQWSGPGISKQVVPQSQFSS